MMAEEAQATVGTSSADVEAVVVSAMVPTIKCVFISDTHSKHKDIRFDDVEEEKAGPSVLFHSGDFSLAGSFKEISDFIDWLEEAPFTYKILIAGNHDITLHEESFNASFWTRRGHPIRPDFAAVQAYVRSKPSVIYLQDEQVTLEFPTLGGQLKVYGSPWQPTFGDVWAFNAERGEAINQIWNLIPEDGEIDVLLTHGPPLNIGDFVPHKKEHVGCADLARQVKDRIKPRVHSFGHIHENYGVFAKNDGDDATLYVNASTCTLLYRAENAPIVLLLPLDKAKAPIVVNAITQQVE